MLAIISLFTKPPSFGMAKRFREVENLDSLKTPAAKATLHGIVTTISDFQSGGTSNYFYGTISDDTATKRLVGFEKAQLKTLDKFHRAKSAVRIADCQIRKERRGEKMQILLKDCSTIDTSPRKINVSATEYSPNTDIVLSSLPEMDNYARVNVDVKVQSVSSSTEAAGKRMQQVTVADSTGTTSVTLWENDIGLLRIRHSYSLEGFLVRLFGHKRYLTMGRQGSTVIDIDDLGEVALPDAFPEDESRIYQAKVVAIVSQDCYSVCLRCSSRVDPITPPYSRCTSCQMIQLMSACKEFESAKLMFLGDSEQMITLTAVGSTLLEMSEFDTSEKSLMSLRFSKITFNNISKTVISFEKYGEDDYVEEEGNKDKED